VLVGGLPASPIPFPQDLLGDWVGRAGNRERIRELLGAFISEPIDGAILDRFLDDAVKVSGPVLECTLQACIHMSFADRMESLQTPILIVGGQRDVFFPREAVAQLARSLPCARGISLPCNHEVPMERPRELAHLIEAFVSGLGVGCRALAASRR
jgi:pimeloyl-ACP methyl ester carboxylesterase